MLAYQDHMIRHIRKLVNSQLELSRTKKIAPSRLSDYHQHYLEPSAKRQGKVLRSHTEQISF